MEGHVPHDRARRLTCFVFEEEAQALVMEYTCSALTVTCLCPAKVRGVQGVNELDRCWRNSIGHS